MYSQTAEYALRAMSCLALSPTELVPTTTLSLQTRVPSNYLAKVLQLLVSENLITGRRGVGGGYKLARGPEQITMLQVINAVSPVHRIDRCPMGLPHHGPFLCPLHRKVDQAAAAVIEIFDGVTLADLINDPLTSKPLCDVESSAKLSVMGVLVDDTPPADRPIADEWVA